jgi:putative membrane protein
MRKVLRNSLLGASLAAFATAGVALPRVATAQALNDPTIVAIFDAANTWDIETAGLAIKRAKAKDVHEFAEQLVRDHKAVRQQGRDLAKKLGVTPTPPKNFGMAHDHAVAMANLSKLHGAAFDRAFLAHEVAYHKAVLDAVTTTLLPALKNAEVKDLVTKVAPAFQAHMVKAQSLLDAYPK